MTFRFEYLDKSALEQILPELFHILYLNMSYVISTEKSYEDEFSEWYSEVFPAMQKEPRCIVLMFCNEEIVGYFQYYINNGSLVMEEIQIKKEFQGSGIFRLFYEWLVLCLPSDLISVEAYSNKENLRSQQILEHLGLVKCGEVSDGAIFYYKGDFSCIFKKYGISDISL